MRLPQISNCSIHFVSSLLVSAILLVLVPGIVVSQAEYCETGVKVGFQGLKINAQSTFQITLNGVSTGGAGANCGYVDGTPKVWTRLVPGRTYDLTSSGTCWVHVKFDIPEGKRLFINDVETTEILSDSTTVSSWKIRLETECSCDTEDAGSSKGPKLGSILWQVGMGRLSDGRSAGNISVREEVLSALSYTPNVLIYSPPGNTDQVDVVKNLDDSLRQIKGNDALADIVVVSGSEYDIRFFDPANVGVKDEETGIYALTGQPFVVWKIKNPNPSANERLQISRTQDSVTETSEYIWDPGSNTWSLATGAGTKVETNVITTDVGTGDRIETTTIKDNNNVVSSKSIKRYHAFAWGDEVISEVSDPDTANLTTTYAFFDNLSEEGKYAHVKSVIFPDGSWEKYDYDVLGNRTKIIRPWKDIDFASGDETNSRVTEYLHYYFRTDHLGEIRLYNYVFTTEEKIEGVSVQKRIVIRLKNRIDELLYGVTESETVYSSATGGQTTVTTKYDSLQSEEWMWLADRISSIMYPDGRLDTYRYEKGDFVPNVDPALSQFILNPNGAAERQTIYHSTAAAPAGTANKTSSEVAVTDDRGRSVLNETYVYTGTDYERVSWSAQFYDARGHNTETKGHDGTVTSAVWSGDAKTSEIDQHGVETAYTYNSRKQVKTSTKKGIAAGGGFPAQADIVTTYTYDAEGRIVGQVTSSSGLSLSEVTAYDLSGRVQGKTSESGLSTTYAYTNGGRITTIVKPGGGTQITENYLDGQVKKQTGTATIASFFEYGLDPADGTRYATKYLGTGDASSPRWVKTTTNWADRAVKVEKPAFNGPSLLLVTLYNSKGQLVGEQTLSGGNRIVADKIHEYDNWGEQVRSGSDIDGNGSLTLSSIDRISDADTSFEKVGSDWYRTKTSKTYLTNSSSTPTTTFVSKQRLNNFPSNGSERTVSEEIGIDVGGNQTITTSTIDRGAKKATVVVNISDSNLDSTRVSVNALVQTASAITPLDVTTYGYDALGRPISVYDPVFGVTTSTYNSTTGELTSESQGPNVTSYAYYASTEPGAGLIKTVTNPNSKKQYFKYNLRGEALQIWGDGAYPVEYVYDSFGQRTEMHTFRAGSGWSSVTWPVGTTGTPDVTEWVYHDASGLLQLKRDAANNGPTYTYDALGRLAVRTWARTSGSGTAISAEYSYDPRTGELAAIDYSDVTPDVTFAADRGGRVTNFKDAVGTSALVFSSSGQLLSHQFATGILDGITITMGYDSSLRRNSLTATRNAVSLVNQTFTYDATSRAHTVTSGTNTATYAYSPNSGLLNSVSYTGGTNMSRTYDSLGRVENVIHTPASGSPSSSTYVYNNLSKRTRATREDNSYWSYAYNDHGEVTVGKKYWSDDSFVSGQQTEYLYDNAGNRTSVKAGGDQVGLNLRTSIFTPNSLNQYSQRTVPDVIDVIGTANSGAKVTVNNQSVYRRGDYFHKALTVDNSSASVYTQISAIGAKNATGTNGEDSVSQQTGFSYLPQANESFVYDVDGNLVSDGRWQYAWDAENRLRSMTASSSTPSDAKKKLEFVYDFQGRRIQKKVYSWNGGSSSYQLSTTNRYIYDNWNLIAELDNSGSLIRSYVWGSELRMISEGGNHYAVGSDGKKNVTNLVQLGTGALAASYEYDPFGNLLRSTGEYATKNPIRFSNKYIDSETNLIYYGYRYYNPQTGNWPSKDPSEEAGGNNLYGFVGNDPVNSVDHLGLWKRNDNWTGGWDNYSGSVTAEKCDTFAGLAQQLTGYASDWRQLKGVSDKAEVGQVVDIAPLLNRLEDRLRDSVVGATSKFRPGGRFEVPPSPGEDAASINRYFGRNSLPSDCTFALRAVFAKGVIDVLRDGEFDKLGYGLNFTRLPVALKKFGNIYQLHHGDGSYIKNYSDYTTYAPRGAWRGENVVALPSGKFWGWGVGTEDYNVFQQKLIEEYRAVGGRSTGTFPGFDGDAIFLDVPKIARQVFDLRGRK